MNPHVLNLPYQAYLVGSRIDNGFNAFVEKCRDTAIARGNLRYLGFKLLVIREDQNYLSLNLKELIPSRSGESLLLTIRVLAAAPSLKSFYEIFL